MENSFFIYSNQNLDIERFHLCTWEFKNGSALMEIGCEISSENLPKNVEALELDIYIPWLNQQNSISDLFSNLKDAVNSKFIFNDSVINSYSLDDGRGILGIRHDFQGRDPLCILPVSIAPSYERNKAHIVLDLSSYKSKKISSNIYFRFSINANANSFSIRKKGVSRSTIIYDLKINEGRNVPDELFAELQSKPLCTIKSCFCFNIVPNSFDLSFFDSSSLQNVRTLEYDAFNRYLSDRRVREDQLMVVFNKKKYPNSFTFFSIFTKERIGAGQFALAILINLISGILLFLPSYRHENKYNILSRSFWQNLPMEVYIAILIGLALIIYFVWPRIVLMAESLKNWRIIKKRKKDKQ